MSYFDRFFEDKPTRIGLQLVRKAMRQALRELLKYADITRVIEIGPGRGLFGKACLERNIEYLGVDSNTKGCELLRQEGLNMVQALVPPFPKDTKPADAFVAMHVIEHMSTLEKATEFVQSAKQLLNKNGLILLVSPDIRYIKEWFWCCNYSHNYVTSVSRLVQLLDENGFEILQARPRSLYFFFPWSHIIWFMARLIPYRLLETLSGRNYERKSIWLKAKISLTPSAFVIARKRD